MSTIPHKKIGDPPRDFAFGNIPPTKAWRLQIKFIKLLGPLFASLADGALLGGVASEQDPGKHGGSRPVVPMAKLKKLAEDADSAQMAALQRLLSDLDEDESLEILNTVFGCVSCEGQPVDLDTTFAGKPEEVWQVLWEGLRVNFAAFFRAGIFGSRHEKSQK